MARPLNPGRLNRWVKVRKQADTPNGQFGLNTSFDAGVERWASIDPVGSVTFYGAKQAGTEITDHICLRREAGTRPEDLSAEHVIEELDEQSNTVTRYRIARASDWQGKRQYTIAEAMCLGVFEA